MIAGARPDAFGRTSDAVAGEIPDPILRPSGCHFHLRCPHANERCRGEAPERLSLDETRAVACHGVEEGRL